MTIISCPNHRHLGMRFLPHVPAPFFQPQVMWVRLLVRVLPINRYEPVTEGEKMQTGLDRTSAILMGHMVASANCRERLGGIILDVMTKITPGLDPSARPIAAALV